MTPAVFETLALRGQRLCEGLSRALRDTDTEGCVVNRGSMTNLHFAPKMPVDYRELYSQQTPQRMSLARLVPRLLRDEGLHVLRNMFVGSTAISDVQVDETVAAVSRVLVKARQGEREASRS